MISTEIKTTLTQIIDPRPLYIKRLKTYGELVAENVNLKGKIRNYKTSMKQLQRAHVVRLYELERARSASQNDLCIIDRYAAVLKVQKDEIIDLRNRLTKALYVTKGANGTTK